ncbi:alpha/beta fold hydrolase [Arthrobacter tumbae]|uniref:alpha/beta fold hydrolase n=1 Tax=Arthrobacter tumbae TaxID=163874 RepID=UPI00195C4F71|nr:alpha/beta fold hydrolase [Arthrobacter tumbae]MBM7783043.1 proline iminopeptidase [Arthrobacter tumbae]
MNSAIHHTGPVNVMRGVRSTSHRFRVPLDHGDPTGEQISLFAREYSSTDHSDAEAARLPWLLFLQGGPGVRGNRTTQLSGWMKAAARDFRILMLDQRGTGFSTPADPLTLPQRGTAVEQAGYLRHFRADSIVADAEVMRAALGSAPWTVFGQSFGGFCTLSYLSFAPEGMDRAIITGGLAPLAGPVERVYRSTFKRVAKRNAEYFGRYPQDRTAVTHIMRHLDRVEEVLPTGERLTPQRFQMVGSFLGGNTRVDALHYLLEDAFVGAYDGDRLSPVFLDQLQSVVSRRSNPLYALLHESIYCQGQASSWAAWRVLEEFPDFAPDAADPLLTGEMVYPWYFDEDPSLVPLQETAELIAAADDWGPLYDVPRLAANAVPAAAAVYSDDIYVDRDLSLETAASVRGLQVWETADFHHDGIHDDGDAIFSRLLAMTHTG